MFEDAVEVHAHALVRAQEISTFQTRKNEASC